MEEGRGEKGPEGYLQCWIAPVLDIVKERKQEIWEKVNLSLTPWLATMCYPQRESSQTERESGGEGEGRRLSNFILSEERKKKKRPTKMEEDALVMWMQLCCQWKRQQKPAKQSVSKR